MELTQLGWSDTHAARFAAYAGDGRIPARVSLQHKNRYEVLCQYGELSAQVTGKLFQQSRSRADLPAVGDWVVIAPRPEEGSATIHAVLPRASGISRKAVLAGGPCYGEGKTEEQVLAANVDTAFLVSGLDGDFNIRRVERFITVAWDSGASPAVILNKADVCADVQACVDAIEAVALGVPVYVMSAALSQGIEPLRSHLTVGHTATFLGSSGVGKSTIINALLGEERLDTGGVRLDDSKGRHTTTHRELIVLPDGGIVIDTPGMRRLTLWGDEESLQRTFSDIEALAANCRFRDCTHHGEPGCAIAEALEGGALDEGRWQNYLRLQKELRHLERRKNEGARRQQERQWFKKVTQYHKMMKELRKKGLA